MVTWKRTLRELKKIKIQGASQIALTSLLTLKGMPFKKRAAETIKSIKLFKNGILCRRPTEPLVINLFGIIEKRLGVKKSLDRKSVTNEVERLIKAYEEIEAKIVKRGSLLIKSRENIFTHCHSSLVEKILVKARKDGKNFHVYNSETRPLFQGRITAKNLIKNHIKVSQVCDSAAAFLISDHSGDDIKINKLIIGADAVGLNGWAVNKIGSFGLALAAWESRIPVYVATSLLKIDPKSRVNIRIPLEKRSSREIWPEAPRGLKLENYAFDYIPAKFITAFITEFGLIKPSGIRLLVKSHYQDLLK
ncbi:MAG: translation initiation factor eIF-2B subunit [Patescibacteria group bacterium]